MALFNDRFNNKYRNNNFRNNNINFNSMQNNIPPDINFKPLTREELNKINVEMQQNIEKNISSTQKNKNTEEICKYIEEFIQDETNASIFYNQLSNKCRNNLYTDKLLYISNECMLQCNDLKSYYKNISSKQFEPKAIPINTNISFKAGLSLAIEEEMKSYDKICKIIDNVSSKDTDIFYKMALKKLNRINFIQHIHIVSC